MEALEGGVVSYARGTPAGYRAGGRALEFSISREACLLLLGLFSPPDDNIQVGEDASDHII